MNENRSRCFRPDDPDSFRDPDCLKCLRKKLNAISLAVFYRDGDAWRLGAFQGDLPSAEAEVEYIHMLKGGLPDKVSSYSDGLILNDDMSIGDTIGDFRAQFSGMAVLASPVNFGTQKGMRLAWRPQSEPFSEADLLALRCEGNCPDGC